MLIFEDEQGLCMRPKALVASLTPAYPQRLRVVSEDGLVGYLPEAHFPPGPWHLAGGSMLHPNHLRAVEGGLQDPAGFVYAARELPQAPAWKPPTYWGCQIGPDGALWLGQQDAPCEQVPSDWLAITARLRLNPLCLRRLRMESSTLKVDLEDGRSLTVSRTWRARLLKQLGLSDPRHLLPYREALFTPFLREYPFELARASAEVLKAHFSSARLLIFQVIWQALNYRRTGIEAGYADTHRGFLYNPLAATLSRAGLWDESCPLLYAQILGELVGRDRLFTYQELGFRDIFGAFREIGQRRPDRVLFIEKESLSRIGMELASRLGMSWLVSGGISHLGSVEYFVQALREREQGPVTIFVYGDFDPGGWVAGRSFARHLERYGVETTQPPHFLIRPQRFTEEELELFARPLSVKNDRVEAWLAETGGIHGQPWGIHADWLPAERVELALREALGELSD